MRAFIFCCAFFCSWSVFGITGAQRLISTIAATAAPPFVNTQSLSFNGSTGIVRGTYHSAQNPATNFTINAWVKGASTADGAAIAAMYNDTPPKNYVFLRGATSGSAIGVIMSDGTNQKYYESSTTAFNGAWHMVTMTFGGGVLKLYVDGNLDNTPNKIIDGTMTSINNISIPLQSGPRPSGAGSTAFYNGKITNLSLWNIELNSTQIGQLASGSKPVDLSALSFYSNCISWYKYGDGDSTSASGIIDSTSNAFNMSITGGVTIVADAP